MRQIEQQTQRIVQDLQQRTRRTVCQEARQIIDRFHEQGDTPLFSEAIEQEVRILRARLKDPAHGLRPRRRRGGGGMALPPPVDSDTDDAEMRQIREELRARRRGEASARTEGTSSFSGLSDTPSSASASRALAQRTGFYSPVQTRAPGADRVSPASSAVRGTAPAAHAPGRSPAPAATKAAKSAPAVGHTKPRGQARPPSRTRAELEGHVAYGRGRGPEQGAVGPEASPLHRVPPRGHPSRGRPRRAASAAAGSASSEEESYSEDDFEDDFEGESSSSGSGGGAQPPDRPEESARGGAESPASAPASEGEQASRSDADAVEPPAEDGSSTESSGGSVVWG